MSDTTNLNLDKGLTGKKPKSNTMLYLAFGVFIVIAGVVLFMVFRKGGASTSPPSGSGGQPGSKGTNYKWGKVNWQDDSQCSSKGILSGTIDCYEFNNGVQGSKVDDSKCDAETGLYKPSLTTGCTILKYPCSSPGTGNDYTCKKCNSPYTGPPPCEAGFKCDSVKQECIRDCGKNINAESNAYICDTCGESGNSCASGFTCSAGDPSAPPLNNGTNAPNATDATNYCYKKPDSTTTFLIEDKICWPGFGEWNMAASPSTVDNEGNITGLWDCQCAHSNYEKDLGCSPILQHTHRLRDNLFNNGEIPYDASTLDPTMQDPNDSNQLTKTGQLMQKYFISNKGNAPTNVANARGSPVTLPCSLSKNWSDVVGQLKNNPNILDQINAKNSTDSDIAKKLKVDETNLDTQWCLLDPSPVTENQKVQSYHGYLDTNTNICSNCRYDSQGEGACNNISCYPSDSGACTPDGDCNCPLGTAPAGTTPPQPNVGYSSWNCSPSSKTTCYNGGQLVIDDSTKSSPASDYRVVQGLCDCSEVPGFYGDACDKPVSGHCNQGAPGTWPPSSATNIRYHNSEPDCECKKIPGIADNVTFDDKTCSTEGESKDFPICCQYTQDQTTNKTINTTCDWYMPIQQHLPVNTTNDTLNNQCKDAIPQGSSTTFVKQTWQSKGDCNHDDSTHYKIGDIYAPHSDSGNWISNVGQDTCCAQLKKCGDIEGTACNWFYPIKPNREVMGIAGGVGAGYYQKDQTTTSENSIQVAKDSHQVQTMLKPASTPGKWETYTQDLSSATTDDFRKANITDNRDCAKHIISTCDDIVSTNFGWCDDDYLWDNNLQSAYFGTDEGPNKHYPLAATVCNGDDWYWSHVKCDDAGH